MRDLANCLPMYDARVCVVPDKKRNTFETRSLLLRQTALPRVSFGFSDARFRTGKKDPDVR